MKYSCLERIVWGNLSKTVFAFLETQIPTINMSEYKRASNRKFKEIVLLHLELK